MELIDKTVDFINTVEKYYEKIDIELRSRGVVLISVSPPVIVDEVTAMNKSKEVEDDGSTV